MKKLFLLLLFTITGVSAQEMVKFTAVIKNPNSDSLKISSRKFSKVLKADAKGVIAGSFAVEPGFYQLNDGTEVTTVYLQNGYDLKLDMDARMFDESIKYSGKGEKENNLLAKRFLDNEKFFEDVQTIKEDNAALVEATNRRKEKSLNDLNDKMLDDHFKNLLVKEITEEHKYLLEEAEQIRKLVAMKGKPSPVFTFENHKGGTTSLADLKGKYVYIDVWATWCGPCRAEIPYLQETEKKYHGKNIEFVSVSIDAQKDHDKWKRFVDDKSLGGIQLMADRDWKSDFVTAYSINGIPRFILVDPDGNVVDADAPRPSNAALAKKLDELLK